MTVFRVEVLAHAPKFDADTLLAAAVTGLGRDFLFAETRASRAAGIVTVRLVFKATDSTDAAAAAARAADEVARYAMSAEVLFLRPQRNKNPRSTP